MIKKNLIIQINENNIKFTLFLCNLTNKILFDKTLFYENNFNLDNLKSNLNIFLEIKKTIVNDFDFDLNLDFVHVINNNKYSKIIFETLENNLYNDFNIKSYFLKKYSNDSIVLLESQNNLNKKQIKLELLNKKFKNNIFNILKINNFKNIKFSSLNLIKQNYFSDINHDLTILEVDYYSTTISNLTNNSIIDTKVFQIGMFDILEKISLKMNVDLEQARELFINLASIPKEDVIDNRIIFSKIINSKMINFTKKDLSEIITNPINEIISFVKEYNNSNIIIVGELTSLNGIIKYSKNYLNLENVDIFKNKIIGLGNLDSFLLNGLIKEIQYFENINNSFLDKKNYQKEKKVFLFSKILNKILK